MALPFSTGSEIHLSYSKNRGKKRLRLGFNMYKQNLALNNQQGLIYHKTQPTNQVKVSCYIQRSTQTDTSIL